MSKGQSAVTNFTCDVALSGYAGLVTKPVEKPEGTIILKKTQYTGRINQIELSQKTQATMLTKKPISEQRSAFLQEKKSSCEIGTIKAKAALAICKRNRNIITCQTVGILPTLFWPEDDFTTPPKITILLRSLGYSQNIPYLYGPSCTLNPEEFDALMFWIERKFKDQNLPYEIDEAPLPPLKDGGASDEEDLKRKRGGQNGEKGKKTKKSKRGKKGRRRYDSSSESEESD